MESRHIIIGSIIKILIRKMNMANEPKNYRKFIIMVTLLLVLYVWTYHSMYMPYFKLLRPFHEKNENLTYVLIWTSPTTLPFKYLSKGVDKFKTENCMKYNCYITSDKWYFVSMHLFDVILFHGPELVTNNYLEFPGTRSSAQRYIFGSIESSINYPISNKHFDSYFNWTWTYKLNSDILFHYITIRDKNWNIIGPKENMHWADVEEIKNTNLDETIKKKLKSKRKAAAWFVSNCKPKSKRNIIAENLAKELKKYGLELDVYGGCGALKCPTDTSMLCDKMVQKDYYFYLAFENSRAADYVTEKLLRSLQNYAIPVVYGGANYSRFMPDGFYLDANKHNASVLAKQMNELIKNETKYYEYFKWHNYYTYHDPNEYPDSNTYCSLCEMVTDKSLKRTKQVYHKFRDWWNEL